MDKPLVIVKVDLTQQSSTTTHLLGIEFGDNVSLAGYSRVSLIKHLEKSLNAFIAKTKKEEVL